MQGADPKRWKWGKYMFLIVENPVLGPRAGGGEVFRYRSGALERQRYYSQADHGEAGAFRADERIAWGLGRFTDGSADRRIGPHRFEPLQRRMGSILHRQEFPDAIQKCGCEEYGKIRAEKISRGHRASAFQLRKNEKLFLVFLGLLRFFLLVHAFGHRLFLPPIRLALFRGFVANKVCRQDRPWSGSVRIVLWALAFRVRTNSAAASTPWVALICWNLSSAFRTAFCLEATSVAAAPADFFSGTTL